MTATHWLIAAIIITLLCILAGLWLASRVKHAANAATYRTANAQQIEREVRALQQQMHTPPRPRHRAGQPVLHSFPVNLEQVRASAVRAGLRDMGRGTASLNPYRGKGVAASTWQENYDRVMGQQIAVHDELPATEAAVQTPAQQQANAA